MFPENGSQSDVEMMSWIYPFNRGRKEHQSKADCGVNTKQLVVAPM